MGTYRAILGYISGKANVASDFASRAPVIRENNSCDTCKFINELWDSVVGSISIEDFIFGKAIVPFTNRAAWLSARNECPDLELKV